MLLNALPRTGKFPTAKNSLSSNTSRAEGENPWWRGDGVNSLSV